MSETTIEAQVLVAVERHVYDRHADLTKWNVTWGDEEELERILTDEEGHLEFTVEDLKIDSTEQSGDITLYYVQCTMYFQTADDPIESDPEIYEAYQDDNGKWCVSWYAS